MSRASETVPGAEQMPETQSTAIAVRTEIVSTTVSGSALSLQGLLVPAGQTIVRAGHWASDTAQKFGTLLSELLGPAVFTVYAFAAWSLASNLGWTNSFIFSAGPLANWIVWLGMAILLNVSASILKRHIQGDSGQL